MTQTTHLLRHVAALAAFLFATTANAQPSTEPAPTPIWVAIGAVSLPAAAEITRRTVHADELATVGAAGGQLQISAWQFDDKSCFVDVGLGSPPPKGKSPRGADSFAWSLSGHRRGEADTAPCERALAAALQLLRKDGALQDRERVLRALAPTREAEPWQPLKVPRRDGIVSHWTGDTLSSTGKQLIADELGARWHKVLDHRLFAAHLTLMSGKSVEGRSFCFARYGVTTTSPPGFNARLPASLRVLSLYAGKGEDCSRAVVERSLGTLRASYEDQLTDFAMVTEPGVSYPPVSDIRKSVARFDAEEAKRATAERMAAQRRAVTVSTQRLSCENRCVNGTCVRTFADGRKETWQAPRTFNPFTGNWEWDTTSNACGS